MTLVFRARTRTQGVSIKEANQPDEEQKFISEHVRKVFSDPNKDELIEELWQSRNNEFTPFSQVVREKFTHKAIRIALGCACSQRRANIVFDTLCFEILCCRCGTIFADEHEGSTSLSITQELNHQWFDRSTIPNNTLRERARREVRHGLSQVQRDYCNAKRFFRRQQRRGSTAKASITKSVHDRFIRDETYRTSQQKKSDGPKILVKK